MQTDRTQIPHGFCRCGCGERTRPARQDRTALGIKKGEPQWYVKGHAHRGRRHPERLIHLPPIAERDMLWLAGLLEGEGCFDKTPKDDRARVRLKMTDLDVVERFSALVGYQVVSEHTPHMRDSGWKKQYCVSLYGTRAYELMELIRPEMGERRKAKIDQLLSERKP